VLRPNEESGLDDTGVQVQVGLECEERVRAQAQGGGQGWLTRRLEQRPVYWQSTVRWQRLVLPRRARRRPAPTRVVVREEAMNAAPSIAPASARLASGKMLVGAGRVW
jgi:hypothetical protein